MTLQSFLMYVSLWRANIPLAKLRKESQLTLQRHRVSRAAALLRGLPSEPLAWEMLLSRVFWLQRVRQSLLNVLTPLSSYLITKAVTFVVRYGFSRK